MRNINVYLWLIDRRDFYVSYAYHGCCGGDCRAGGSEKADFTIDLPADALANGVLSNGIAPTGSGIALNNSLTAPVRLNLSFLNAPPTASYVEDLVDDSIVVKPGDTLVPAFYAAAAYGHPDYVFFLTYREAAINGATGTVPEPSTWALAIAGFALVGMAARRRRTGVTA